MKNFRFMQIIIVIGHKLITQNHKRIIFIYIMIYLGMYGFQTLLSRQKVTDLIMHKIILMKSKIKCYN